MGSYREVECQRKRQKWQQRGQDVPSGEHGNADLHSLSLAPSSIRNICINPESFGSSSGIPALFSVNFSQSVALHEHANGVHETNVTQNSIYKPPQKPGMLALQPLHPDPISTLSNQRCQSFAGKKVACMVYGSRSSDPFLKAMQMTTPVPPRMRTLDPPISILPRPQRPSAFTSRS